MSLSTEHEGLRLLANMEEPMSLDHIKKIQALNSPLAQFLKPYAIDEFYHRKWDFDGNAILDDFFTLDASPTATEFAPSSPQIRGGALVGTTGTTDNGAVSILGEAVVRGDEVAIMKARFKVSAITSLQFEVGLVDAVTDRKVPVISDVDTPANGSNGAGDLAVIHMDTDQTLATMAFVADGSTSGMDCQKSNLGVLTPTADTFMKVMVAVYGNNAVCIVNGQRTYRKILDSSIEGGTLLKPWLLFRSRAGSASRTVTLDYVELMGGR